MKPVTERAMKDLFDARAELIRLQSRESELLRELLDIRKAIEGQKAVIKELVRARAVPCIDRLPDELLAQIFLLIVYAVDPTRLNGAERTRLASVSRRWRAIIMDISSLWSCIYSEIYQGRPRLLKLHLERSRQAPLTVSLHEDLPELDVVLLHVNRIRVLRILGSAPDILDRFASLTFPALEDLFVDLESDSVDLLLSMYSRAPALKCLQLDGLDESSSAASLTTDYLGGNSLTRLSLEGTASWQIPRDSIHFPVLESLALRTNDPISFLEAIVVPKLKHFDFSEGYNERPVCRTFCGPTSKFDNVHHLVFSPPITESLSQDMLQLAMEICRVFRGRVGRPDHHPGPIGSWTHLESLDIRGFTSIQAKRLDRFMDWLMKRRNVGQLKLRLKLIGKDTTSGYPVIANALRTLQDHCASVELYRICILEPLRVCRFTAGGHICLQGWPDQPN
ncbi:hypothetical protein EDD16DRAFT_69482 [Pisolithus croceorrhizus]|nr:hypothetical protein EDD16DRAFT_69482 [Pisolithus croceorrhizus]KAI6127500.1 hypothetical protein EV401DRAFT_984130 [Pisolithus croceorrhizus]KAI6149099.1 hypothetical protein EDD17DRAFT_1209923 [Pisolithus thermaeus]